MDLIFYLLYFCKMIINIIINKFCYNFDKVIAKDRKKMLYIESCPSDKIAFSKYWKSLIN